MERASTHVDSHTPTLHVQIWMEHNSCPQLGGMKVSGNQDQWKSVAVCSTVDSYPPVSLPNLSCDNLAAQCVLQVLTFFEQVTQFGC